MSTKRWVPRCARLFRIALGASLAVALAAGAARAAAPANAGTDRSAGGTVGSGDGRIHIIPSLSAPTVKNGQPLTVQAVVKSVRPVAKVEARIERESTPPDAPSGPRSEALSDPPVATLALRPAPTTLGGVNGAGTLGLWQAEWTASGLEERWYRVILTAVDSTGHAFTDRSLRFSDPIAGRNTVGSADYATGGMRRLDAALLPDESKLTSAVIDTTNGYAYFGTGTWTCRPARVVKVALETGLAAPQRVGAVELDAGEDYPDTAVIDVANGYAYFGTDTSPGRVVKVALGAGSAPPTRVGAVTLDSEEFNLASAVIDAANGHAYFGTSTSPGRVVKVALGAGTAPPTRLGAVTLNPGENDLTSAVIDAVNGYAYFGNSDTWPGRVVKVALGAGSAPPTRAGAVTLNSGENGLTSAVIDAANGYAYFGTYTFPGQVVKVALGAGSAPPTRVEAVTLNSGEGDLSCSVIDAANGCAYFGTGSSCVVKVALGAGAAPPVRVGALTLDVWGQNDVDCAVIDAVNGLAYFGVNDWGDDSPPYGTVAKVALSHAWEAPTRVGAATLNAEEEDLGSAVIDTANGYAYFGTYTFPGQVVKVALGAGSAAPTRVGATTLDAGEGGLTSAVIDTANGYAYFGTDNTSPGQVVKVALGSGTAPPSRVGAVTLNSGEDNLRCAVIDAANGYAYFGTHTYYGQVVKVALGAGSAPPTRVDAVTLDEGENFLGCAVIDAANGYAYFGTGYSANPGQVVKVALGSGSAPPSRVGAVTLNYGEDNLTCAVIDAANGRAYFGRHLGEVVKVALGSGSAPPSRVGAVWLNSGEDNLTCAVIDVTNGYAYFGTYTVPGRVVKVALGSESVPPTLASWGSVDPGEYSLSCAAIDPANGYAYFGTDHPTRARVVKVALGDGSTPPSRLGAVTLAPGEYELHSAVIDAANGYAYFGTGHLYDPGRVVKVGLGAGSAPPTRLGAVTLNSGEDGLTCAVIDASNGYAYFGTHTYTSPGRVVKVALGAGSAPPTRVGAVTLNSGENGLTSAVIDAANGYAYFGTDDYPNPGRVVKVALGAGASPPSRVGAVALNSEENDLTCAVIDAAHGYAYFGVYLGYDVPARVVKVALGAGSAPPTRVGAVDLYAGETNLECAVIDAANGLAYFAAWRTYPGAWLVKVGLGTGSAPPTRLGALRLNSEDGAGLSAVIDAPSEFAYLGTDSFPGRVVRVGLSPKGFVNGTKFAMPQQGEATQARFYSHAAAGSVRLAIYDSATTPSLLWQSPAIANTAAGGWLAAPISAGAPPSLNLTEGNYWLAWQVDTATPVGSEAWASTGDGLYVPRSWGAFPPALGPAAHTAATLTNQVWSGYVTYSTPPPYTVTFQTDGTPGAMLTGATTQTVGLGADCTPVTANAPQGFHLVKWTKDGAVYSIDNPLTVAHVTEDMTLVAHFAGVLAATNWTRYK